MTRTRSWNRASNVLPMRALELIALLVSPLVFSVVAADARRWQSHGAGRDAVIRRAAVRRRR